MTLGSQEIEYEDNEPSDNVQMPHPAGTDGLPPLSLDGPVVLPDLSLGVATGCAHFLLDMEVDLSTPAAQSVGLVAPLSKGAGSLGHGDFLATQIEAAMKLVWWTREEKFTTIQVVRQI